MGVENEFSRVGNRDGLWEVGLGLGKVDLGRLKGWDELVKVGLVRLKSWVE